MWVKNNIRINKYIYMTNIYWCLIQKIWINIMININILCQFWYFKRLGPNICDRIKFSLQLLWFSSSLFSICVGRRTYGWSLTQLYFYMSLIITIFMECWVFYKQIFQERKGMENKVAYIEIVPLPDEETDSTNDAAFKGNVCIQCMSILIKLLFE